MAVVLAIWPWIFVSLVPAIDTLVLSGNVPFCVSQLAEARNSTKKTKFFSAPTCLPLLLYLSLGSVSEETWVPNWGFTIGAISWLNGRELCE